MPDYLVLDSDVSAQELTEKLYDARKDPAKRSPNDVTDRLVSVIEHPETGEQAVPLSDVRLPIRNPDPPTSPNNVTLPDQAEGKGAPDADFWHERLDVTQWGEVVPRSDPDVEDMEDRGWFPDSP